MPEFLTQQRTTHLFTCPLYYIFRDVPISALLNQIGWDSLFYNHVPSSFWRDQQPRENSVGALPPVTFPITTESSVCPKGAETKQEKLQTQKAPKNHRRKFFCLCCLPYHLLFACTKKGCKCNKYNKQLTLVTMWQKRWRISVRGVWESFVSPFL